MLGFIKNSFIPNNQTFHEKLDFTFNEAIFGEFSSAVFKRNKCFKYKMYYYSLCNEMLLKYELFTPPLSLFTKTYYKLHSFISLSYRRSVVFAFHSV